MHNYIYNMYIHPHKQNKSTKLSTHLVQKNISSSHPHHILLCWTCAEALLSKANLKHLLEVTEMKGLVES
jgi:hypothetical protein